MGEMLKRYQFPTSASGLRKEDEGILSGNWVPSVDIKETKNAYIEKGEIPGVKKSDVDVTIEDNTLIISGEKNTEKVTDDHCEHRTECVYGSFERSFPLPKQVDANNVQASFSNGVLELSIPKAEEAKPKQIQVKIN